MQKEDNLLYVVVGDDVYLTVTIFQPDGTQYIMQTGDKLIFSIKKNWDDLEYIQSSEFFSNVISIPSSITTNLVPGQYVYDVCLKTQISGSYNTIIPLSQMVVIPSVRK